MRNRRGDFISYDNGVGFGANQFSNAGGFYFSPSQLSGLVLRLEADKIVASDNDFLAQWDDTSGNGNHCTQSTAANRPVYKSSGAISGRPEVAMTYKDLSTTVARWMTIPTGVSIYEDDFTIIFIGRPVSEDLLSGYAVPVSIGGTKLGYGATFTTAVVNGGLVSGTKQIHHEAQLVGITGSTGGTKLWTNSEYDTFAQANHNGFAGGRLGSDGSASYYFYGSLYEVLVYNRGLSDNEMAKVYSYARGKYFGNATKQIVFDGDSLTTGYACLNNVNFPAQLWGLLGRDWDIYNAAVAGQTLSSMESDAATQIDPLYSAINYSRNILVCWAGILDVYYGATVAQALSNLDTYCTNRQGAGWEVVVLTALPTGFISETDRLNINVGVRANFTSWSDRISDIGADPTIGQTGDNTNPLYYNNSDGMQTHLTQLGFSIVAQTTRSAIIS